MGGSCSRTRRSSQGYAASRMGQGGSSLDYDVGVAGSNMLPAVYGGGPGMNTGMFGGGAAGMVDRSGYGGYGYASTCPEGVNQNTALLITAAAIAVGAAVLFRAITLQQAGRKKRSADPSISADQTPSLNKSLTTPFWSMDWNHLYDTFWTGLEEFEEKMEKMSQNQTAKKDKEEKEEEEAGGSWINSILREFVRVKEETEDEIKEMEEEALEEAADEDEADDLDNLEPPLLDMSWAQDQDKLQDIVNGQAEKKRVKKRSIDSGSKKMSTREKKEKEELDQSCKIKIWRCMSGVMESGVKYLEKPGGIMGLAKQALFKIAFHGGLSNPWSSLMTIPEARKLTRCMREHDDCVTKEILGEQVDNQEVGGRRVLVNPEFVQGMDSSDGQYQYDKEVEDMLYEDEDNQATK